MKNSIFPKKKLWLEWNYTTCRSILHVYELKAQVHRGLIDLDNAIFKTSLGNRASSRARSVDVLKSMKDGFVYLRF